METMILSGMGSSTSNWLPFIAPLAIVVIIAYSINAGMKYLKRKKLNKLETIEGNQSE